MENTKKGDKKGLQALFLLQWIFTIIILAWLGLFIGIFADWLYKRDRYRVKLLQESGRTKSKWLKPDATGKKFVISVGGIGRGNKAFEPEFDKDCVLEEGRIMKHKYVMVIPFAEKCINFKSGEVPPFSLDQLKEFVSKKLLSMQAKVRTQTQGILYLIALIVVIDTMFLFFLGNALGVVRLR